MKTSRTILHVALLLLPALLFLSSCRVEKRLHQKGYHVEWQQAVHKPVRIPASGLIPAMASVPYRQITVKPDSAGIVLPDHIALVSTVSSPRIFKKQIRVVPETDSLPVSPSIPAHESRGKYVATTHKLALAGSISGILAAGFVFASFYVAAFFAIAAFVMTWMAFKDIRKRPDLHKGKLWAVLGLVLSAASVVAMGLLYSTFY